MNFSSPLLHRRVVVTGMGAMTPLGNTLKESWKSLLLDNSESSSSSSSNSSNSESSKQSGITSLTEAIQWQLLSKEQTERELDAAAALSCQVAAPVQSLAIPQDPRTPRFVQMTIQAGREALLQSQILESKDTKIVSEAIFDLTCIGVCVGSGMSGVREIVEAARTVEQRGLRRLSPHFVPKVLSNSAAGRLSLEFNLQGPNHSVSTACAAGTHALGDAMRCIQYGNATIMLAGGAEACIDPLSLAGFTRLKALSTNFNNVPHEASRPFDRDRDGFVMGEGAAILVLEELDHAQQRGAPILAELCGYGLTGDAHHITAPAPDGKGAERAMRMALNQAAALFQEEMDPTDLIERIGYINAHATSTPKGDEIEAMCINRVFGHENGQDRKNGMPPPFVSSTKGATGHLLGAAGAIEAAFTVLSLVHQTVPPTRNLQGLDPGQQFEGFQHVCLGPPPHVENMEFAMSNSFGFGGTNASIVLRKWNK